MTQKAEIRTIAILLQQELQLAFSEGESLLLKYENQLKNKPESSISSNIEKLDRCLLLNHYCFLIIERKLSSASYKVDHSNLSNTPCEYTLHPEWITEKSLFRTLKWMRPQHLNPSSSKSIPTLLHEFQGQYQRALLALQRFTFTEKAPNPNRKNTHSKSNPDVYHYLWFMAAQMRKQLSQLTSELNNWEAA